MLRGLLLSGYLNSNITVNLEIINGQLNLLVNATAHESAAVLQADVWHRVRLAIRRHVAELSVDGISMTVSLPVVVAKPHCLTQKIRLGSSGSLPKHQRRFEGCVRLLWLNGKDLFTEKKWVESSPSLTISRAGCVEAEFDCSSPRRPYVAYTMPYNAQSSGSPFMYRLPSHSDIVVRFHFSSDEPYGILATVHGSAESLYLYLNDSRLCILSGQSLAGRADGQCLKRAPLTNGQKRQVRLMLTDNSIAIALWLNVSEIETNIEPFDKLQENLPSIEYYGGDLHVGHSSCSGIMPAAESEHFLFDRPFTGCFSRVQIGRQCLTDPLLHTSCLRLNKPSVLRGCNLDFCSSKSQICLHNTKCSNRLAGHYCNCRGSGHVGPHCGTRKSNCYDISLQSHASLLDTVIDLAIPAVESNFWHSRSGLGAVANVCKSPAKRKTLFSFLLKTLVACSSRQTEVCTAGFNSQGSVYIQLTMVQDSITDHIDTARENSSHLNFTFRMAIIFAEIAP